MCGIFVCIKNSNTKIETSLGSLIIKDLNLLKNRGYDSCGIFLTDGNKKYITKYKNKISNCNFIIFKC